VGLARRATLWSRMRLTSAGDGAWVMPASQAACAGLRLRTDADDTIESKINPNFMVLAIFETNTTIRDQ
jgi:hypothetical protein